MIDIFGVNLIYWKATIQIINVVHIMGHNFGTYLKCSNQPLYNNNTNLQFMVKFKILQNIRNKHKHTNIIMRLWSKIKILI